MYTGTRLTTSLSSIFCEGRGAAVHRLKFDSVTKKYKHVDQSRYNYTAKYTSWIKFCFFLVLHDG